MIITLGILSLFQLTFLPGLILVKAIKIHGFWENIIVSLGLSQIFNYLFVLLAVMLKIYTQTTVLVLFGIEVLVLIILYFPNLNWNLGRIISSVGVASFFREYLAKIVTKNERNKTVFTYIYYFVFATAILCLARFFFVFITHPTDVFYYWDAVISWNKWALEWFQGIFPTQTWHYPQLFPANLSIPYQFIGTKEVQYFSKYFANLLEFFIIAIVFYLGVKKKDVAYFLGVFFTSWLMMSFGSKGNGYADSPVAFFALLAVVCLLFAEENEDERKFLILGAFFVSGAALTKQAGLWLVLVYPVFIALRKSSKSKKSAGIIIQAVIIMVLMIVPWYLFKEIQIQTGIETSEIKTVTSLVLNKNDGVQILEDAHKLFLETIKNPYVSRQISFTLLIILFAFSFMDRFWRKIGFVITIPYWIGWIFFFSYENRNLVMVVPLIALAAGIGLRNILHLDWGKVINFFHKKIPLAIILIIKQLINWVFKFVTSLKFWYLLLLIPILFILPRWVSDGRLIKNSQIKRMNIGDAPINEFLKEYKAENGLNGKILTDYQYLGFLPDLENYYEYSPSDSHEFIEKFSDPEIGYALVKDHWWSGEVHEYIMTLINEKKINLIYDLEPSIGNGRYYFVTTCHGVCK